MRPLIRWAKFNMVGVLGMGVQLAMLAGFNRLFAGHYLLATCAALELTLLHNFFWHERFTWADRRDSTSRWRALLRFHLANGLVSLCGNLLLMRALVQSAHLPLLLANVVAIVCCSAANFVLGTRWAFVQNPGADVAGQSNRASVWPSRAARLYRSVSGRCVTPPSPEPCGISSDRLQKHAVVAQDGKPGGTDAGSGSALHF